MKTLKSLTVALGLSVAAGASAQLNIPTADISLAFPGLSTVTINIGGNGNNVTPTPFVIQGLVQQSVTWFCLDPLQTIFYNGNNLPVGSTLNYPSSNPADFDLWNVGAPGLTAARLQNLADLFQAYYPTTTNALVAGALQLSVWEIANEFNVNQPYNLSAGQVQASGGGGLVTQAQAMLDSLDDVGIQGAGRLSGLSFLIDGSYTPVNGGNTVLVQDLVGYSPVPEPSTYGLAAMGLLAVGIVVRNRRRKGAVVQVA